MKLSALGLAILFLLTGCSSPTSLEEKIKLIEYEKCISAEKVDFSVLAQNRTREELQVFLNVMKKEGQPLVDNFIRACKKYRP